jgi:sporulation protein YlmC with PRC-barrel domain
MKGFDKAHWPDFNVAASEEPQPADAAAKPYSGERFRRASEMVKAQLRDDQGKDVGDVKDLLVRTDDARVAHVVVEFDRSGYDKGGWVALPMSSVRPKGRDFVAAFKADHLRSAATKDAKAERGKAGNAEPHPRAVERAATDRDERVSKLLGRKVVDPAGQDLARVKDLVIDTVERRVAYAILSVGGVARIGDKPVAYPMPAREAWIEGDKFVLQSSQAKLKAMPEYEVERPYEAQAIPRFMRASDLLDIDLVDHSGRDVGNLRDIVVNMASGEVRYVVADFDSAWVQDGKLFAVPFRQLRKAERHHDPVMQFGLNELHGWMIFDEGKWPDLNDPRYRSQVERYANVQ